MNPDASTTEIDPWLQQLWDQGGSDLLLSGGSAPRIRVDGKLRPLEGASVLTGEQIDEIALPLLTPGQVEIFKEMLDVASYPRSDPYF
jgi:twitching motility protein PilT